jgi:hypothetical protein
MVGAAAFLINMLHVFTNGSVIPMQELFGKKPQLRGLVTVGALGIGERISGNKLADREVEQYMVGYGEDRYGYWVWETKRNCVSVYRDFKVFKTKLYQHILGNEVTEQELTNEVNCYLNIKKENLIDCAMLSQTQLYLETANTINNEIVEDWSEAIEADMRSLQKH